MTERCLADFIGTWRLTRTLVHDDGSTGDFSGIARWQAQGTGADYIEEGELVLAGRGAFRAERRYRWDADLNVFFDDGRFFHTVPAAGGKTRHHCPPDMYFVRYSFTHWPDWAVTWHVKGPRKAYTIATQYRRSPQ